MQNNDLTKINWKQTKDGLIDLIAGTIGGVANVYTGQPLDTIKVKMQTFPKMYKSWIDCFVKTFQLDGISGLYAGITPALIANIAENAVLFTAYGYCQKIVAFSLNQNEVCFLNPINNGLAGSLASVFAAAVLCPTELIKCQLQAARETNNNFLSVKQNSKSIFSICRKMYYSKGISSFYVGMTSTLIREIPGCFVFFSVYETCRNVLTFSKKSKNNIEHFKIGISGAAGGATSWAAIYPIDVIKSRIQTGTNGSFFKVFINVVQKEGFLTLYKGLLPTLIKTCVSSAFLFIAYESTKSKLHQIF